MFGPLSSTFFGLTGTSLSIIVEGQIGISDGLSSTACCIQRGFDREAGTMLTNIRIRNFKRLRDVEIELGKSVVLIGPNNSGKTAALQALALWEIGLRQWSAKRGTKASPVKRPGVAINRKDLISIPVSSTKLLWSDLHVREGEKVGDRQRTKNIRIDVVVRGISEGREKEWECGFEFDYSNEESIVCRPVRKRGFEGRPVRDVEFTDIPLLTNEVRIVYLPPMSGLAEREFKSEQGQINVLLGEGQTAQVLRNLCYQMYERPGQKEWQELCSRIRELFGVELMSPKYVPERSEITMQYEEEPNRVRLDLPCSGRGFQQTLLLLAYLYANPKTVLLLDEPDAHLEVLRQSQTYKILTEVAEQCGSQIIAASHSEVVLNEAADKDTVIAFVGKKPHRINDRQRRSQLLKALNRIGFDQYYLAEQKGWVLYLEGPTDLAILQRFAKTLEHEAEKLLEQPFKSYVGNNVQDAYYHFYGLLEAYPDLVGIAVFDRLEKELDEKSGLTQMMWKRRELENYLCIEDVLLRYARGEEGGELFASRREKIMKECIDELASAARKMRKPEVWSADIKATDDFLDPLFDNYYEKLGLPNLLRKTNYHILAGLVPKDKIDREIVEKLNAIVKVAKKAKPEGE